MHVASDLSDTTTEEPPQHETQSLLLSITIHSLQCHANDTLGNKRGIRGGEVGRCSSWLASGVELLVGRDSIRW